MDADRFINHFTQIATATNGISNLRKLIIRLAIQGRLVKQEPDEESSFHLIQKLKMLESELIKKGEIKKKLYWDSVKDSEKNYEIPKSWQWVRLGHLGKIVGGGTPTIANKEYFDVDGIPWVTPADLHNNASKYVSRGLRSLSELGLINSSAKLLPESTVLFSSRAPIGYVAIASNPLSTNQGFKSCVPLMPELSDYIYYYLMAVSKEIEKNAKGTTFKEISGEEVARIPVSLPPLEEQKRIINKIEELLVLCDQLETQQHDITKLSADTREASLAVLMQTRSLSDIPVAWKRIQQNFSIFFSTPESIKSFRKLIYDMACTGRLSERISNITPIDVTISAIKAAKNELVKRKQIKQPNRLLPIKEDDKPIELPSTWTWIRLGEICKVIEYGTSQKAHNDPTGVPVLRMGNIVIGEIDYRNLKYVNADIVDLPRLYLKMGDLIFNRTNSYELVGKMGIFKEENNKYTLASYLIRISLFDEYVLPEWVNLFFQSLICRKTQIEPNITKQTNQANFNGTKLANVMIPLAPLEEQRDIVKRVEYYLVQCSSLGERLKNRDETQNKFAIAAMHAVLKSDSRVSMSTEKEKPRKFQRKFSAKIRLVSPAKENSANTILTRILKSNDGTMEAKELWKASKLERIDDFYAILKQEIANGLIQKPEMAEFILEEIVQ